MNPALAPPVHRYLEELEHELKQLSGISPEEALSDAREFLENNRESLLRAEPGLDDDVVYDHFVDTFGKPEKAASEFGDSAEEAGERIFAYAPGWRTCCTKCGRSSPAAGVRIGAVAWHKYTIGYCINCRFMRWFRVIKDVDRANLTQLLGVSRTPDEVRRAMHRPWLVMCLILILTLVPLLITSAIFVARTSI